MRIWGGVNYVVENLTSSSSRYITFPTGRMVINATIDNYKQLSILNTGTSRSDGACRTRCYVDVQSGTPVLNMLDASTTYSVTYSYVDL